MISVDHLYKIHTVYTHANCPDGMASAILIRDALPGAAITFVQHNTEEHLTMKAEKGVLFVDFAPHESRVDDFVEAGAFILDHHKTARPIVEAFGDRAVFGDEVTEPGVCGAVLAYRHVWKPIFESLGHEDSLTASLTARAHKFATLAGIRDTWQKDDADWFEACAQGEMLRFYPAEDWLNLQGTEGSDISMFEPQNDTWWANRMALGHLILKRHAEGVKKAIARAYRATTIKGTSVVILSDIKTPSDAAEALGDEADLVMGFFLEIRDGQAMMNVSTRTRGDFDCAAFCKRLGGGGHTKAAGFSVPVQVGTSIYDAGPNPYAHLLHLVNQWEQGKGLR